jgi:hypothetical protein
MVKRFITTVLIAFLLVGTLPAVALAATGPAFTTQPGGGAPAAVWSQQPQVSIMTGNNVVESATGTIQLSVTPGTGTAGAVLSCAATTVTLVNGVAAFTGCKIDLAGTGYRLRATWSQGGTDDSAAFAISSGGSAATKLGFTTVPARGIPGVAFPTQPTVALQNAAGTTVTGAPATAVTLALGVNPGAAVLTCTGGLTKTSVIGVASFSGCQLDKVGVGYTLIATATGLTSASTALFDVADRLGFTTQPGGAAVGFAFTTQPVVAVRAGASATAIHDNATTVTLALGVNPGGAVLTCTGGLSKVAVAGLATFAGCAISKAGTGYTLVATSAGLTSATTTAFNVSTGTTITLTNSAGVITWGNAVGLTIQFGTNGANKTFVLEGARDGVTFVAIATLTTNASGLATFSYRPATNLYYRARFAGTADLVAGNSNTTRTVVRQIALLRPTNFGAIKSIARSTSITFTTTVRPSRPELPKATVSFVLYRRVSGVWTLVTTRNVVINSLGKASTTFTFSSAGSYYVRSIARPTTYNANSVWSPVERYNVR